MELDQFFFRCLLLSFTLGASACGLPAPVELDGGVEPHAGVDAGTDGGEPLSDAGVGLLDFHKVILEDQALPTSVYAADTLTPAQVGEDFRFVAFFLEHAYAAHEYWAEERGVVWSELLTSLQTKAGDREKWSVQQVFDTLIEHLKSKLSDGHMSLYRSGIGSSDYSWESLSNHFGAYTFKEPAQAATADLTRCTATAEIKVLPKQVFIAEGGNLDLHVVLAARPITSVECVGVSLNVQRVATSGRQLPRTFSEKELDATSYYVRMPSFSNIDPTLAARFVASADQARAYSRVVLDLRGNPGGNPESYFEWLERLGVNQEISVPGNSHASGFGVNVLFNNFYEDALNSGPIDPSMAANFRSRLAVTKSALEKNFRDQTFDEYTPANFRGPELEGQLSGSGFSGEVLLLVDEYCYSACEYVALISKQIPKFAVLGESNTGGTLLGADALPLPLPNSKLVLFMPTGITTGTAAHDVEGYGVSPDVWVSPAAMRTLFP